MQSSTRSRKPKAHRVAREAPLPLSPSRREILQLLHEHDFLTPRLLAVAYGAKPGRKGHGLAHIRAELRNLYDAGLVERFYNSTRPSGEGSEQFIYTATVEGAKAVLQPTEFEEQRNRISKRAHNDRRNFDHAVSLATLRLVLQHGPGPWRVAEFRGDARTPGARMKVQLGNRMITVWPDASVLIEFPGDEPDPADRRALFHFELDLSRRNSQRLRDRFAAYAAHLATHNRRLEELRQRQQRRSHNHAAVVFIAPNEAEVERFMIEAADTLSSHGRRDQERFLFWNLRDWYEDQTLEARRSRDAEPHQWTVRVLRDPKDILGEASITNVRGVAGAFGHIG